MAALIFLAPSASASQWYYIEGNSSGGCDYTSNDAWHTNGVRNYRFKGYAAFCAGRSVRLDYRITCINDPCSTVTYTAVGISNYFSHTNVVAVSWCRFRETGEVYSYHQCAYERY